MALPAFEIQETTPETLQEDIPINVSQVIGEEGRDGELADAMIEIPAFVEDDAVIISHDDAKPEDVAEAEAAVKLPITVDDGGIWNLTIGSSFDGPAELLPSAAESNVSDTENRDAIPAETDVTEGIPEGPYGKADVLDFGLPSPSNSPVHLEIKDTSPILEPAESAEPSVGVFNVDDASKGEDVRDIKNATEDPTSTSEVAPKIDTPSIAGALVYLWSPFEEISNKIIAEDDSNPTDLTLEEPIEKEAEGESVPVQTNAEPRHFGDKLADALLESDPISIIAASVLGGAAVLGTAAIIAHSSSGKSPSADNETHSKSTEEGLGEPAVSKQVNEELTVEPATQTAQSPVHGIVLPEADVKQDLEVANSAEAPVIVVSSPPASPIVGTSGGADERTAEVIEPTPGESTQKGAERESGEIFSHPVWNQSITPFLHFSLENTAGGLKKRPFLGPMADSRPVSSGNDTVSTKHQKNMMRAFWNVIFFGWLGGFGRILSGMFGKSKKAQRNAN